VLASIGGWLLVVAGFLAAWWLDATLAGLVCGLVLALVFAAGLFGVEVPSWLGWTVEPLVLVALGLGVTSVTESVAAGVPLTVLGLLPLALGWGEGAEMRAPMAITVIVGLLFSTGLTLVIVPLVYDLVNGTRSHG